MAKREELIKHYEDFAALSRRTAANTLAMMPGDPIAVKAAADMIRAAEAAEANAKRVREAPESTIFFGGPQSRE